MSFLFKLECSFSLQNDCQGTTWSRLDQGFLGLNMSKLQCQYSRVWVLIISTWKLIRKPPIVLLGFKLNQVSKEKVLMWL